MADTTAKMDPGGFFPVTKAPASFKRTRRGSTGSDHTASASDSVATGDDVNATGDDTNQNAQGTKKLTKSSSVASLRSLFSRKELLDEDAPPVPPIPPRYAISTAPSVEHFPTFDNNDDGGKSKAPEEGPSTNLRSCMEWDNEDEKPKGKGPKWLRNMKSMKSMRTLRANTSTSQTSASTATALQYPHTAPVEQTEFSVRDILRQDHDDNSFASQSTLSLPRTASEGTGPDLGLELPTPPNNLARTDTLQSQTSTLPRPYHGYGRFTPRTEVFQGIGQNPPPDTAPRGQHPARLVEIQQGFHVTKSGAPALPQTDVADIDEPYWNDAVEWARNQMDETEAREKQEAKELAGREPSAEEQEVREEEAKRRQIALGSHFLKRTSRLTWEMDYSKWSEYMTVEETSAASAALQYARANPSNPESMNKLLQMASHVTKKIKALGTPRSEEGWSTPKGFPKPPKPRSKAKDRMTPSGEHRDVWDESQLSNTPRSNDDDSIMTMDQNQVSEHTPRRVGVPASGRGTPTWFKKTAPPDTQQLRPMTLEELDDAARHRSLTPEEHTLRARYRGAIHSPDKVGRANWLLGEVGQSPLPESLPTPTRQGPPGRRMAESRNESPLPRSRLPRINTSIPSSGLGISYATPPSKTQPSKNPLLRSSRTPSSEISAYSKRPLPDRPVARPRQSPVQVTPGQQKESAEKQSNRSATLSTLEGHLHISNPTSPATPVSSFPAPPSDSSRPQSIIGGQHPDIIKDIDISKVNAYRRARRQEEFPSGSSLESLPENDPAHVHPEDRKPAHRSGLSSYEGTASPQPELDLPEGANDPYGDDEMDPTPSKSLLPRTRLMAIMNENSPVGAVRNRPFRDQIRSAAGHVADDLDSTGFEHPAFRPAVEHPSPSPSPQQLARASSVYPDDDAPGARGHYDDLEHYEQYCDDDRPEQNQAVAGTQEQHQAQEQREVQEQSENQEQLETQEQYEDLNQYEQSYDDDEVDEAGEAEDDFDEFDPNFRDVASDNQIFEDLASSDYDMVHARDFGYGGGRTVSSNPLGYVPPLSPAIQQEEERLEGPLLPSAPQQEEQLPEGPPRHLDGSLDLYNEKGFLRESLLIDRDAAYAAGIPSSPRRSEAAETDQPVFPTHATTKSESLSIGETMRGDDYAPERLERHIENTINIWQRGSVAQRRHQPRSSSDNIDDDGREWI